MTIVIKEFEFKSEDNKKVIEGAFFYDEDVISEDDAEKIILDYGCDMNNSIFSKDAPCFFLPKAQADMLRHSWIPQKVDRAVEEALLAKEERMDL